MAMLRLLVRVFLALDCRIQESGESRFAVMLLLALVVVSVWAQDLTIRTRAVKGNVVSTEALYIHGERTRSDVRHQRSGGVEFSSGYMIGQCELGRNISVDSDARTYAIRHMTSEAELFAKAEQRKADIASGKIKPPAYDPKAGTVTTSTQIVDTGERKEIGGVLLRHVKEVQTEEVTPGSPIRVTPRIERDIS